MLGWILTVVLTPIVLIVAPLLLSFLEPDRRARAAQASACGGRSAATDSSAVLSLLAGGHQQGERGWRDPGHAQPAAFGLGEAAGQGQPDAVARRSGRAPGE